MAKTTIQTAFDSDQGVVSSARSARKRLVAKTNPFTPRVIPEKLFSAKQTHFQQSAGAG